jgi:hypothetical protein
MTQESNMAAVSPSLPVDLEQVRSQLIDRMMRNGDWNKWVTSVAPSSVNARDDGTDSHLSWIPPL